MPQSYAGSLCTFNRQKYDRCPKPNRLRSFGGTSSWIDTMMVAKMLAFSVRAGALRAVRRFHNRNGCALVP
jgi:hypothetical protein